MIICLDQNIPQGQRIFGSYGKVRLFNGRDLAPGDLADARALIVRSITRVDEKLLADSQVEFVGSTTIGTDHVDLDYLHARGIRFAHAPGCNSNAVSEYITDALLEWSTAMSRPLSSATLGIVGFGNVGKKVRDKAVALGMKVWVSDPPLQARGFSPEYFVSLEKIIQRCDILSLHVPLVLEGLHPTRLLISQKQFRAREKPLSLFNTSRGEVIEESFVMEAKKKGLIDFLILDVYPGEPEIDKHWIDSCDLMTPHIAGHSIEGKLNAVRQVSQGFAEFFRLPPPVSPEKPLPENPLIQLSETEPLPLQTCVNRAFFLARESARFKNLFRESDPQRAFEKIRNKYPVRWEFSNYTIKGLEKYPPETGEGLKRLGFQI